MSDTPRRVSPDTRIIDLDSLAEELSSVASVVRLRAGATTRDRRHGRALSRSHGRRREHGSAAGHQAGCCRISAKRPDVRRDVPRRGPDQPRSSSTHNIVSVATSTSSPATTSTRWYEYRGSESPRARGAAARAPASDRWPLECASRSGIGVCAALEHAHALTDRHTAPLDIVHRDVSLGQHPRGYRRVVEARGRWRAVHGMRRARRPAHGSPQAASLAHHVAPSRPSERRSTRRSDLFALGIVLYEITTGERLFPPCDRDEGVARADHPVHESRHPPS